jgi:hypothetical protein
MTIDEQGQQANPDEQVNELGGEGTVTPEADPNLTPSGDEFDSLSYEEAIAKLKAQRAILQRNARKVQAPPTPASPAPKSQFVTIEDFRRANRERAKVMATTILPTDSDEVKAEKAEIAENWNDVSTFVRPDGEDTPEDIVKGIRRGYVAWKHDPYRTDAKNPAADLATNTVVKQGGKPQTDDKPAPRRKTTPMKEWYKAPE